MRAYNLPTTTYKLVVLVGPTSSGKSELAVKLAKRFNGEIISADSRQIYRRLDLGTGKVPGRWRRTKNNGRYFLSYWYKGIGHHLIDFVDPKRQYSSALFQRDAKKAIAKILQRGKLPILCGGTAHWIDALIYNQPLPNVEPNLKLRLKLDKKSADGLYRQLKKLDPARAKTIDRHNKHRLIRALEIVIVTGKPVASLASIPEFSLPRLSSASENIRDPDFRKNLDPGSRIHSAGIERYNVLWLGIKTDQKALYKKIDARLKQRLKAGLVKEVADLHQAGLSWKRLESFGLEYKYVSLFLQKKLSYKEMLSQLSYAIKHYSKRQMTWWKRNKEIQWIKIRGQAERKLKRFLV